MKIARIMVAFLFVSFFTLLVTPCKAQTAEEMLSACRPIIKARISNGMIDLPQDFGSGQCWGAFGMLLQVSHLEDQNDHPVIDACVPCDATRTELIAIFARDVEQNPKEYPKDFQIVAINAMVKAYPCTKK